MEEVKKLSADEIVNEYGDLVYRIAVQYTGNTHEAEDITQDTFLAMLKKLPFESKEHVKRWLIRVAVNKCKDYYKSARRKNLPLDENANTAYFEQSDGIEELEKLEPLDRSIIYLFYYEGYSAKEIASMIGKTKNAVNIRLSRARETLKGLLKDGDKNE